MCNPSGAHLKGPSEWTIDNVDEKVKLPKLEKKGAKTDLSIVMKSRNAVAYKWASYGLG